MEKTFFYFRGNLPDTMPSYRSYVRTGYAKRRKSRKSRGTTKSKRTRFARPKRRTVRSVRKRGVVSRIPRLIGDLQYNAKRPLRFTTVVKQLYTWRVTPEVVNSNVNGCYPSTMYIPANHFQKNFINRNGAWSMLHKSYSPGFLTKLDGMYEKYAVLGAKMAVTVKPLAGNNEDASKDGSDGGSVSIKDWLTTFNSEQGNPNFQSEGMILATVGLTPDVNVFPAQAADPDVLFRAPMCKSHRSIYKRQELMYEKNPNGQILKRHDPTTPIIGKQMSFSAFYSPKKLFGTSAMKEDDLKANLNLMGTIPADKQEYFFIDLREFIKAPAEGYPFIPDCYVTASVEYKVAIMDIEGQHKCLSRGWQDVPNQIYNPTDGGEVEEPTVPIDDLN